MSDKLKLCLGGAAMGVMMIALGIAFLLGKVEMPRHRVLGDISVLSGIFFILAGLVCGVVTVAMGFAAP